MYRVFHLKRKANCISICKLRDINITIQTICFVMFLFVTKNLQNAFAADVENVHHLLEDKHPPEILLPVGVLSYSVLRTTCQDTHC
jgi:hypothetical protein